MKDLQKTLLKKSKMKEWDECRFLNPLYMEEVKIKARNNPLIDFTHFEYLR